ncbi:hypothetical protein LAZ67_14001206 [Cordylochernes scorpioides]|uniref:Transposase n=1 Tax=Cordylochernes scorpioides TaxID=51811 RepID=A0ABY6L6S9_9ARAC|nr:hypothetical protein LAZ67_14001206 [Cordylochernes scorpioides]
MRNLREAIRQKRPDLWKNKNWLLHHDNAPAHTSLLVRDFLAKNNTLMMPQPPYSPDLAPCDFFLFPKLKRPMKGRRYATLDEIKTASKEELKNDFLKCFEDWTNRWHKSIISHGDYFEGDKIGAYIPSGIVARSNLHPIPLTSPDTAITSIAICLEQSIIVVHSAYWHGLRAADDFIPLLEDTIRRASLPVILGMDTNAHSPTWGIGARLDFRGANLEEFASFNDLHFLGPPVDSTWSNGPLSSSIDVTLAFSSLAIHVTRGLLDEMAFTDHIPIWTTFLGMVNNETKSSWVESSCKEQTFKSFLNSSLHQDKVLLVKFYYCNSESSTEALRAFRNFKGIRRGKGPMSCYSLRRMIKNFEKTGSLEAKPRSGRPSTRKSVAVTVSQNVEAIETLSTYGEVSARQVSRQTGISYGTVWRALRIFLKKYPYKIQRFHELKVGDFEKRQEFAAWVFQQIDIDENWLSNVLWTDEAHFSLDGEVNTQNSRIWATENPRIFTEMPLHQPRVTVWCGFTSSFIIGPFFFE